MGGSYGHIWATACAANAVPERKKIQAHIARLILTGGFSPFVEDLEHAKHSGFSQILAQHDKFFVLDWNKQAVALYKGSISALQPRERGKRTRAEWHRQGPRGLFLLQH